MDYKKLLNVADSNKNEAKYESSIKTYSTVLPPPKKPDRASVKSEGILRFLAKKKAEEEAKAAEARKRKEKLLELRSQNSKNNKKAKIMASRTKDNDFSKIKLSEDDILSKKKIEMELQRKHLLDKKERMKARIELEEKEAALPRKRKRKSKQGEALDNDADPTSDHQDEPPDLQGKDRNHSIKNGARKTPRPLPPTLSFSELLKVAEKKQHEPIVIPKKKEEERLMTKKERKIAEEERERLRRKQERLERGIEPSINHRTPNDKIDKQAHSKDPHIVHIEKDKSSNLVNGPSKFKIPKSSSSGSNSLEKVKAPGNSFSKSQAPLKSQPSQLKEVRETAPVDKPPLKSRESAILSKKSSVPEKITNKKPNGKIRPVTNETLPSEPQIPKIDTEALTAAIERKVREKLEKQYAADLEKQIAADIEKKLQAKLEKEMAEKFRITLEEQRKKLNLGDSAPEKIKRPETKKVPSTLNGKIPPKSETNREPPQKVSDKYISIRKEPVVQKNMVPKAPPKKHFHKNPYLDPPRRLLEPLIPPKRKPSRVIEDDDDEDEDDDMSDFIDDGPSVEDENYSQYITQIFGYDRRKYVDEDDDDIMETSYSEQMKEEMKSARQGLLEDLEEERKQRKEEMERKKKKMKLKK